MKRIPAYEREPYRTELDVEVMTTGEDGGRPFAVLDDTLLYPEGGGQPADRGRLGEAVVVDVQRLEGEIRHFLDRPAAPGPAPLSLDWERRYDHMQQHTAQHLLSAVAADRFGWPTTAFHLGEESCDIELDTPALPARELAELEEAVAAEVRADRPVSSRRVRREQMAELPVRTRGLPAGHRGDVRLVEIEGLDLSTCGGTHLRSTAEIEAVKLLATEPLRGGTRLVWVAGGRVRRRLGQREAILAELRSVLGTADGELAAIARLKLDQLQGAQRRGRRLEARLAEAVAEGLASRPGLLVSEHFADADGALLQQVALGFAASEHPGMALLTAESDRGAFFALAAGSACPLDLPAAGRRLAEALGGRGGGGGQIFQGKTGSLARREEAEAALRAFLEPSCGPEARSPGATSRSRR